MYCSRRKCTGVSLPNQQAIKLLLLFGEICWRSFKIAVGNLKLCAENSLCAKEHLKQAHGLLLGSLSFLSSLTLGWIIPSPHSDMKCIKVQQSPHKGKKERCTQHCVVPSYFYRSTFLRFPVSTMIGTIELATFEPDYFSQAQGSQKTRNTKLVKISSSWNIPKQGQPP